MILYPITKLCWGEEALIIIAAFVLLSCVSLRWTLVDSMHFHSEDIRHSTEKLELLFLALVVVQKSLVSSRGTDVEECSACMVDVRVCI